MTELTFDDRVAVCEAVVARELDGGTVVLNLDTGIYFGLDAVGTDMWRAILASESLKDAIDVVQQEYDVEPGVLRDDLLRFANQLAAKGLLQAAGRPSSAQA